MEELASFSGLVERIYDASLDAALWPQALEQACAFVQGCSTLLVYQSSGLTAPALIHTWGENLHYFQLYHDRYAKLDPLAPSAFFLEVGKVHALDDVMPMAEFRASRLYNEWAKPQGILDALHVNLERTATGAAAMIIRRRECDGPFGPDAKSRFQLIAPHLQRAIAIGKVIDFHKANETALSKTLDGLDAAVMLVAANGRLVHFNSAGSAMLTKADTLSAPNGRLSAVDPRVDMELQEAKAGAARGDIGLGVKGVAISLESDDRTSKVAHILSLASGRRRDMLHSQAVAAVFVRRTTFAEPAPLKIVAQLYGLTAAEVRVLAALAASSSIADMARMLGLGEATVKSHLQRLFTKTGARRQLDLIKLLASHGSPLES